MYTTAFTISNLEQATPSGFDYRPNTSLTATRSPEYSITGKPYPTKCMLLSHQLLQYVYN